MSRVLLSGNEAIAYGAWEAGAVVGVGYPGTPSTETLQRFAKLPEVYAEWAPNEKVALEVAAGVSMAGKRSLVTMKHVGLNVASDPLFTLAYTGVGGGLVLLVADDPGMHSSQNEQDSHNYAVFARIPVFDPSDSSEALAMTKVAFELSERFDTPVMVRSSTRLSHAKSMVEIGERAVAPTLPEYRTDPAKWVMMPAMARKRRMDLEQRFADLEGYVTTTPFNRIEMRDPAIGIVCSGICYEHVREAMPEASILKLGVTYPLAEETVRGFASGVERLYVVEEGDAFLVRSLKQIGVAVEELGLPVSGELTPGIVRRAFGIPGPELREAESQLPPRPPLMCPGCPHRPVFRALRRTRAVVTGDIGCYTLGALPPLSAMDSCVDMGASIGMAHGMDLAGGVEGRPVVAVIGDSTFAHSGVTALMNTAYNGGSGTVLILDNRITAMTGHQGNPVNGITLQGRHTTEVDLVRLVEALGITRVRMADPHDVPGAEKVIREEIAEPELSVIIFKAPCALLLKEYAEPYGVDEEACTACGSCIKLGCPAIAKLPSGKAFIDMAVCSGCGQCPQVCRYDAIQRSGAACDIGGGRR